MDERERLGRVAWDAFVGGEMPWADIADEAKADWMDAAQAAVEHACGGWPSRDCTAWCDRRLADQAERVRRLEAVAESAREVVAEADVWLSTVGYPEYAMARAIGRLRNALAALGAPDGEGA